ncbi:related to Major Facilitator invovled in MEL transport [Ustilago trichophora]|uniref:MFS-type efflux pump MMF1 n=1 Tax=Ustilago trichophora TaxID=86804 RepID=A0A5C3EFA0_9BASI|nr:related to Major Facilitator invovled in MEL transport [Ustilago trichophora]
MSSSSSPQAALRYAPRRWVSKTENSDSLTQRCEPNSGWGKYSLYIPYSAKMERLNEKATMHRMASIAPTSQDDRLGEFYSVKSCRDTEQPSPLPIDSASSSAFHHYHRFDRRQQQDRASSSSRARAFVSQYSPPGFYRDRLAETSWSQSQDRCFQSTSASPNSSYASAFSTDDDGGIGLSPVSSLISTTRTRSRPKLRSLLILSHRNKLSSRDLALSSANGVGGQNRTCSVDTSNSVPLSPFEGSKSTHSISASIAAKYRESNDLDEDSNFSTSHYRAQRNFRSYQQRRISSEPRYDFRRDYPPYSHRELRRSPSEQDSYWAVMHIMNEKTGDTLPATPTSLGAGTSYSDHEFAAHMDSERQGSLRGAKVKKTWRFWVIFTALMLVAFCAALDMTMISTALPAIVADLPESSIAANWVTSAFLLPMVASQPIFGGLSCSIGRKSSINAALVIFLVGSVVCACAKSLLVLVIGRGIQGLGGGGIHSMCEIIMSDLTTLRERGLFFGLIALVFAVAGFAAPVMGGAFSERSWPWIFWINLPIGAIALVLLALFLNIKVPLLEGKEKWQRLDLFGNTILFGSVTSVLIAVTEGGIKYHWSNWRVWVPLVAGLLGLALFLVIEWVPNRLAPKPVFPLDLFKERTAAIAYVQTFIHGVIFYGIIYMVPIYFQSIKDRTPLESAIWSFPLSAPSFPLAMAAGISISLTGKYKLFIFVGWVLMAAGIGWMTHWHVDTSKMEWIFSQIIAGAGVGILFPITLPPIQAALPASRLESATSAYAFTRTFGAVWGITGATTIFSTQAAKNLKPYYPLLNPLGLNEFTIVAFSEHLDQLPSALETTVKKVYADAISYSFWLFVPLAIIGFFSTFGMKALPLPDFIKSEARLEQKEDALPALGAGTA